MTPCVGAGKHGREETANRNALSDRTIGMIFEEARHCPRSDVLRMCSSGVLLTQPVYGALVHRSLEKLCDQCVIPCQTFTGLVLARL